VADYRQRGASSFGDRSKPIPRPLPESVAADPEVASDHWRPHQNRQKAVPLYARATRYVIAIRYKGALMPD